jgi:predicted DNA-binding transcriptional regulator AlpA
MEYLTNAASEQLGFLRLFQIVGDRKRGIEPLIPVCRSTWWAGCRTGRFPRPVRLGPNTVAWRRSEILALLAQMDGERESSLTEAA